MLVLTSLSIIALLGCVALSVDYGLLMMDASRLQRACDAAALAGATKLKRASARPTVPTNLTLDATNADLDRNAAGKDANTVAWKNDKVPVDVSKGDVVFSDNDSTITVRSTVTRRFFFARALGIPSGQVVRFATARVKPISELSTVGPIHVAPIGISWDTYDAYKNDQTNSHDLGLVRQNKNTFGKDDMVLFDLRSSNGKSGAQMENQLTGSDKETVKLGDSETTLNAAGPSETGKLGGGLDTLFSRAAGAPWYDSPTDNTGADEVLSGAEARTNPRVVYLIVTPSTTSPNNGTFDTPVQGFVPVYIESYDNGGSTNGRGKGSSSNIGLSIRVRFLPPTTASNLGLPTSSSSTYYSGANSISLTN